ncbi:MAG: amidohydrolase family protein, partial [Gelidibacter sp.]
MKKTLLFCSFLVSSILIGQNTYLHCGKLIDTKEGKVLTNKTIIVSGKKIMAIEDGFSKPKSVED